MREFTAVIEHDADRSEYVGRVPGIPGVEWHGETVDEVMDRLSEEMELLIEDER